MKLKKGITTIKVFLRTLSDINLTVVSENIKKNIPDKNVIIFNLLKLALSFEDKITKNEIKESKGI